MRGCLKALDVSSNSCLNPTASEGLPTGEKMMQLLFNIHLCNNHPTVWFCDISCTFKIHDIRYPPTSTNTSKFVPPPPVSLKPLPLLLSPIFPSSPPTDSSPAGLSLKAILSGHQTRILSQPQNVYPGSKNFIPAPKMLSRTQKFYPGPKIFIRPPNKDFIPLPKCYPGQVVSSRCQLVQVNLWLIRIFLVRFS